MRILMVSAELAPLAKTGGLADAVAGLSAALAAKDHDVRVLIPDYTAPPSGRPGAAAIEGGASVSPAESTPVPVYLIASPAIGSGGAIYLGDERDAARFWAFSRAAVA
ncbi:MAG: glycogen/starch synthase, partial [Gammaproteobacteria bacterium]